jgi:hypothetical protein
MQQLNVPLGEHIWDCMSSVNASFVNLESIEVEIRTYPHFHSLNFVH